MHARAHPRQHAARLLTSLLAVAVLTGCTGEPTDDASALRGEAQADAEAQGAEAGDGRFGQLAPADQAPSAPWADLAWEQFGMSGDGQIVRWANEDSLWNSFVPALRDDCLAAGPEATRPMWDNEVMIPAGVNPRWNDEATQGRGQFVEFVCAYDDAEGEPVERWWGTLIRGTEQGELVAQSEPFDVRETDYPGTSERTAGIRERMWEWISSQPADQ
jgi:hypothetical protein